MAINRCPCMTGLYLYVHILPPYFMTLAVQYLLLPPWYVPRLPRACLHVVTPLSMPFAGK